MSKDIKEIGTQPRRYLGRAFLRRGDMQKHMLSTTRSYCKAQETIINIL